ncbi:MAG: PhzF family phenazine biosynthesis protein [Pseudomonadota bacterium]
MIIPLYIIDAFTSTRFRGNPAAVCPLDAWLDDAVMQNIAAENNLAETAFLVKQDDSWNLRWFTPTMEIELCGHATLASAFMLALEFPDKKEFRFHTLSGELTVTKSDELYTLDFPARALLGVQLNQLISACLGVDVLEVTRAGKTLIAELENEETVRNLVPDFANIKTLDCSGLIITARGDDCDFVSRFFAPRLGINEDPVTGSTHCGLIPYWQRRLEKKVMVARQLSPRGGELQCELKGDRVLIGGNAVLFMHGTIFLT